MAEQEEVPYKESELYRIRHSAAHVMAQAVLEMFPRQIYDRSTGRGRLLLRFRFTAIISSGGFGGDRKTDAPDNRREA
jgi:hypothetical protein